jgi:eukaryotic-like serine/threonine-protein kinase
VGAVYKGVHRNTGEVVAIKVLNEDAAADDVLIKRFEREFKIASRLHHPHIVRSLDLNLQGKLPYLVMEFVEGPSVGDLIEKRGRLPEAEAIALITQVADALQEAHAHGIYHRDVKPDNILLTADGQAKLADLGIAKDSESEADLTSMGRGLGTPHFMAPEQLANAKNVDARCDVYALGATLYMMVTGVLPFFSKGPIITVFKKKAWNQYTPPRELVPALGDRVDSVIHKAMKAEIGERYASCLEFITALTGKPAQRLRLPAKEPTAPVVVEVAPARTAAGERRSACRRRIKARGACRPIASEKHPRWQAEVKDISAQGIALLVNRRFEPSALLLVRLEVRGQGRTRSLLARVVRTEAQESRKWLLGCCFCRKLEQETVKELLETA